MVEYLWECFLFLISDACSPGSWSNTGLPHCVECDIGYYEDAYGSTGCSKCPGNKITVTESSTTISKCIGKKLCLIFSTFLVDKNINCFSYIFIQTEFIIIKLNIGCFRFCSSGLSNISPSLKCLFIKTTYIVRLSCGQIIGYW